MRGLFHGQHVTHWPQVSLHSVHGIAPAATDGCEGVGSTTLLRAHTHPHDWRRANGCTAFFVGGRGEDGCCQGAGLGPGIAVARWVGHLEQLGRCLAKAHDLLLHSQTNNRVSDGTDIHTALVRQVVEHVVPLYGFSALLLAAEYEVYPPVQVGRHVVTLQGLPVDGHKPVWVTVRPGGQCDVINNGPVLQTAKLVAVAVDQHVWQIEQFRDQLLYVRGAVQTVVPGPPNGREHAGGMVEPPPLQIEKQSGVGLDPDEPVQHIARSGVVAAVVEGRGLWIIPCVVALNKLFQSCFVECPDRL
eukprot:comp24260_c1_seq1/m.45007 comp24260_c1_seq1/g.45007  ORF comp24260_c1_seq1/g.45007 comp24260_c1_seq1/m.45007 type:complete len:302 (+) comp24260_c1_seq1:1433-2338(+)